VRVAEGYQQVSVVCVAGGVADGGCFGGSVRRGEGDGAAQCPAASARLQQFARVPGASAVTYAKAASALRRCASTRPRTALTCASTRATLSWTSSILAKAAVASSCFVTNSGTRHGRPELHACKTASRHRVLILFTYRYISCGPRRK
jgi:hypothetical protein